MDSKSEAKHVSQFLTQKWNVISEKRSIKLDRRVVLELHFCYDKHFWESPLGKDIVSRSPRNVVWG